MLTIAALLATLALSLQPNGIRVYQGPDGQRVEIVSLSPSGSGHALLRLTGTDGKYEGLVVHCDVESSSRGVSYVTVHAGERFGLARQAEGRLEVTLPASVSFSAKFSQTASHDADAAAVVKAYDVARAAGASQAFARKPWPFLEAKYEKLATTALAGASKACGVAATFQYAWWSFDEATLASDNPWTLCEPLVTAVAKHCDVLRVTPRLVCQQGSALGLERNDAELHFTMTAAAKREASGFLRAHLGAAP